MKRTPAAVILLTTAVLTPWAGKAEKFSTLNQLNDAGRGAWADDTADVLKPRQLLYESKEDGQYKVSYNLIQQSEGAVKGYFVRLTIRNLSDNAVEAADDVTLIDAERSVISATDRETFLGLAKTLADTKVPTEARKPVATQALGNPDFFQAYLRGQAEGAILKANADVATGRKMTVWADSFWLAPVIKLPPHGQVSGVRVFLAEPYHPLPLTMNVQVGASEFEFTTRTR